MKLFLKQTQAYKLALSGKKQVILYGGAIRGGKTWWLLLTFISLCSKFPNSRWAIIRRTRPVLKQNTINSFNQLLQSGLDAHVKDFNGDSLTVTFNNNSQIIFMAESYDDDKELNRFRGLEINGAGVDEINEIQEATFYKLIERSGTWLHAEGKPPILILATCNPTHNWVKKKFHDAYHADKLPKTWEYIQAKIYDNPHIPQSYLQSLKENMPPDEYQKFVEGDWNIYKLENLFASQFDESSHISELAQFIPSKPIIISVDFNLNPFAVTFNHFWQDSTGIYQYVFDEAEIENGSIPAMVELIKMRYGRYLWNAKLTGDAMGKARQMAEKSNSSFYQLLIQGLGMSPAQLTVKSNPTHENSRADINQVLFKSKQSHSKWHYKINPECTSTIRDFRFVQWDSEKNQIKKTDRKDEAQKADHMDTQRYVNYYFWKPYIISYY